MLLNALHGVRVGDIQILAVNTVTFARWCLSSCFFVTLLVAIRSSFELSLGVCVSKYAVTFVGAREANSEPITAIRFIKDSGGIANTECLPSSSLVVDEHMMHKVMQILSLLGSSGTVLRGYGSRSPDTADPQWFFAIVVRKNNKITIVVECSQSHTVAWGTAVVLTTNIWAVVHCRLRDPVGSGLSRNENVTVRVRTVNEWFALEWFALRAIGLACGLAGA